VVWCPPWVQRGGRCPGSRELHLCRTCLCAESCAACSRGKVWAEALEATAHSCNGALPACYRLERL
jgi:hypothetical protein